MKTKLTAVLIILSALLLTGCDAILEAYYGIDPEEGWTTGDFRIDLILEEIYSPEPVSHEAPIRIALLPYYQQGEGWYEPAPWDVKELEVITDPEVTGYNGTEEWVFTAFVTAGQYSIGIWHDLNNNGSPDWEEPSRLFEYWKESEYGGGGGKWTNFFDLFEDEENHNIEAFAWMWEFDRMPEDILNLFNSGAGGDAFGFHIEGPMLVDTNAPNSNAWYYVFPDNPGTMPTQVSWRITLDGMEKASSGGDIPLTWDGSNYYFVVNWNNAGPFDPYWRDYELQVDVELEDAGFNREWRFRNLWIPAFPELNDGLYLDITVDLWDLNLDPVNLDFYGTYAVWWEVWHGHPDIGGGFLRDSGPMVTEIYQGNFNEAVLGQEYNKSSAGGTFIRIIIDNNRDYMQNSGDFAAVVPVFAQTGESTTWVGIDPWAFFPEP